MSNLQIVNNVQTIKVDDQILGKDEDGSRWFNFDVVVVVVVVVVVLHLQSNFLLPSFLSIFSFFSKTRGTCLNALPGD